MPRRGYVDGIRARSDGKADLRVVLAGAVVKRVLPSRLEAIRVRDELRAQAASTALGVPGPPVRARVPTLGQAFDRFIREAEGIRRRSPKYVAQLRDQRRLWVEAFGEDHSAALSREDMGTFVEWLWSHPKRRTRGALIKTSFAIIGIVLRHAELAVPKTPPVEVPRRAQKTVPAAALIDFLGRLEPGTVPRVFAELALRLGLRESEVRRIQIGDVDVRFGQLLVRHAKGRRGERGSEELVPLPPELQVVLRDYLGRLPQDLHPTDPLLAVESTRAHVRGRHPLRVESYRRELAHACTAARIPVRGAFGWLRAQAATLARGAGAGIGTVQGALGHETPTMTLEHYDESNARLGERWRARLEVAQRVAVAVPLVGYGSVTLRQSYAHNSAQVVPPPPAGGGSK